MNKHRYLNFIIIAVVVFVWAAHNCLPISKSFKIFPEIKRAQAVNYLTNPSFTGGATGWTLSGMTYDGAVYQDAAGSVQTYAGKKTSVTGTATQNSYNSFLETDPVVFSTWWRNTRSGNGNIQFFAEIAEINNPNNWTTIWSSAILYGANDWTGTGNIDVSNYFGTGSYRLRLRVVANGGPATGSFETGWFDNVNLDVTLPTFNQSAYRFFANQDSTDVGDYLANQNATTTLSVAGAAFRLRMLLHVDANNLPQSGEIFKLQFVDKGAGTCASPSGGAPATYTDVSTSTVIAYKNNTSPSDGDALASNGDDPIHGIDNIVNQTYEELNNFTNSIAAISAGEDGKWDFSLFDNNSFPTAATYCFRVVKSNGNVLDTYDVRPEITTSTASPGLTLTIDPLSLGVGVLIPNNPTSATSTAAVYVNGVSSGYNLQIKRDDASSTLDLTTDSGINFPDLTPWDPSGNGNATTSLDANLSFRIRQSGTDANYSSTWWGANDSNGTAKYAGLPATSQQVINCNSGSSCNNGTTTSVILYRLDAPINQPVGSYDGMITFTALVNP